MRSARKKRLHDERKLSEERTKRKWVRPVILPYAIPGADLVLGLNRLLANIDKTGDVRDEHLAESARVQFESVFRDCFVRLLQLAECQHNKPAKQWAATLLAWFDGNLGKHRGKLAKVNPAYLEAAKIGTRADVAVPKSPIGQILHEELRTAEHYRFKLLLLRELFKEQKDLLLLSVDKEGVEQRLQDEAVFQHLRAGSGALWTRKGIREIKKRAREGTAAPTRIYPDEVTEKRHVEWQYLAEHFWKIPKDYWPLADFPDLFLDPDAADALERFQESSKKWWAFIWSRIKQKQDTLLPRLREHGKGRAAAKRKGVLYLKHFQKEFQNHWQALVREGVVGTF